VVPGERAAGEGRPRRSPASGAVGRAYALPTVSELPPRAAEPGGDETW
jgi:hypothetical protein